MKRELLFRVWHPYMKKFLPINVDDWTMRHQGDVWVVSRLCATPEATMESMIIYKNDDPEVQQAIGVKDTKRKDIFEGDVVKWQEDVGEWVPHYVEKKGVVKWDADWCQFVVVGKDSYGFDRITHIGRMTFNQFEIIGNIFETPELLDPPKGRNPMVIG